MTVLIPIYNAEKTIEETIESILNQKNDQNLKVEILLLNDGSTDNSENICKQYVEKYDNIKYFLLENRGVSPTRNDGLKLAQGKYILFLDSDDLIDEETIQANFNIFEQYYDEADILAYPIYKYVNNEVLQHPRTSLYEKTYVCDVDKFPHLNQTSMNVIIKNLKDKIFFNETMPFAEDTFFNIDMILRTGKIIVSSKGKYIYRTNSYSTVNKFKSPVKTANYLMDSYISLISKYESDGKIPKYIQSVILYELNWRMKFNGLFPRHFEKDEYNEWESKYKKVLSYIEPDVVLTNPNLDKYHQYYFLRTNFNDDNLKIKFNKDQILIQYNNKAILNIKDFFIIFTKFKIKNEKLLISGFVKKPLLELFWKDLKVFFVNYSTNEKVQLNLYKSNYGYYKSNEYTNLFLQFDYEIPLKIGVYDFYIEIKGNIYKTRYYFNNETIIKSHTAKERRVYYKDFCINTINDKIAISTNNFSIQNLKNKLAFYNRLRKSGNLSLYTLRKNKKETTQKINLYSDRHGVFSEAYQLFKKNLAEKKDEQHYYIYKRTNPMNLLQTIDKQERRYFVEHGSLKHKNLFLNADKIFTSSTNYYNYSPFIKKEFNIIAEYLHYDLVWLKGFMSNGLYPRKYAKEVTNIDFVYVKTEEDKNNLVKNYNYLENQIIIDKIKNENNPSKTKKHILISFTWRNYLIEPYLKSFEEKKKGRFANSDYYHNLMKLLNSEELNELIENGYKVDFYLHPYFQMYSDFFNFMNMKIKYLHKLESVEKYDLLISDYSSLINTFELLGKNTIKYHIDYNEFKCGNHIFYELLDETDYLRTHDELLKMLRKIEEEC